MSTYEDDHPSTANPEIESPGFSLDDILDELQATGGEGIFLVDSQGRRIVGEGLVEAMAGTLGRIHGGASDKYISSLPSLTSQDISSTTDDACAICQTPYKILLHEEELNLALDSPAVSTDNLGIVQIGSECRHFFCRRDAAQWLAKSNSCPLCRKKCDLSVETPSTSSTTGTPGTAPPNVLPADPRQEAQDLLASLFSGSFSTPAPPTDASAAREEEDTSFMSMYG
ncbi:Zinc finger, RING-type [Phaffia rhodozyma]|uniref:Zinc finger, RING-type n=1 Tax=Phaffia rhodozyma TaxID=264483 RepID=A0A0F7SK37_PHARH|nr:Zinc finger, RING-type [Phaffia rhodozyma]